MKRMFFIIIGILFLSLFILPDSISRAESNIESCKKIAESFSNDPDAMDDSELARLKVCVTNFLFKRLNSTDYYNKYTSENDKESKAALENHD